MALRLIATIKDGNNQGHIAKVYRDAEWEEYRVRFTKHGNKLGKECDYHTNDKADALNSADAEIKRWLDEVLV